MVQVVHRLLQQLGELAIQLLLRLQHKDRLDSVLSVLQGVRDALLRQRLQLEVHGLVDFQSDRLQYLALRPVRLQLNVVRCFRSQEQLHDVVHQLLFHHSFVLELYLLHLVRKALGGLELQLLGLDEPLRVQVLHALVSSIHYYWLCNANSLWRRRLSWRRTRLRRLLHRAFVYDLICLLLLQLRLLCLGEYLGRLHALHLHFLRLLFRLDHLSDQLVDILARRVLLYLRVVHLLVPGVLA